MADKQDAKALAVTLAAGLEKDLGAVSAYAIAVEHGYEGTEEEWAAEMQKALNSVDESAASAQAAKESADAAAQSAKDAQSAAGEAAEEAARAAAELVKPEIETIVTEQIAPVNEAVTELQRSKADAIVETASGESLHVDDASGNALHNLKVYGKATQVKTNGYQLFDASKIATKTENVVTVTNNGDGSFTVSGSGTMNREYRNLAAYNKGDLKIDEGILKITKSNVNPFCVIQFYDSQNEPILTLRSTDAENSVQITKDILDKYQTIQIGFYSPNLKEIVAGTIKPMIYQDGDGTWEPFTGGQPSPSPEYPQKIEVSGGGGTVSIGVFCANLVNLEEFVPNKDSVSVSADGNNLIVTSKKPYSYGSFDIKNDVLNILKGKRIKLTRTSVSNTVSGAVGTLQFLAHRLGNIDYCEHGKWYTVPEDTQRIEVAAYANNASTELETENTAIYKEVMMFVESDESEFIPFKEPQTLTVTTPNGLPGIPVESGGNYTDENGQQWVSDYVDFERGKYVQCVKVIELLSSFDWRISYNGRNIYYLFSGISLENNKFIISNYFRNGVWNQNEAGIINAGNGFSPAIALSTIDFPTVESLKTWLDEKKSEGKPCYAIYRLEKPVETDLSAEEIAAYKALHTNKLVTNVFSDSDPQVGIQMDYGADTKTYIDKKFDALATAILNRGE